MDWEKIARAAPYHLATAMEECPFDTFWVTILDNGLQVYQDEPRPDLQLGNPWLRLSKFCEDQGAKILGMAMVDKLDPNKQINLEPNADGYFYSKRARLLMGMMQDRATSRPGDNGEGVGYLKGNHLIIFWKNDTGQVEVERRDIDNPHPKHNQQLGLIRN